MKKILLPGLWYGEPSDLSLEELHHSLPKVDNERDCILLITEIMKKGDFSVKNLLIDLMNQTEDEAVLNLCIRLFCSVCTHDDLKEVKNFRFLDSVSEFGTFTFVTGAVETMSYQVIPYILTLWQEWEDSDSDLEMAIKDALDTFLDYRLILSEDARLEEVGNLYIDLAKAKNLNYYYYKNSLAFPGLFTQEIMTALYTAAQKQEKYHLYLQSSLLSIYTGEKVPVETNVVISSNEINEMNAYIKHLSTKNWLEGIKYFYGHPVNNRS